MKTESFDVFVIGSGVAGKTVAENCSDAGLKVAIAECRELGGTCANRGCDPKKVLFNPTKILQQTYDLKGKGISKPPKLDWKKLQEFKKTFTADIPEKTEKDLLQKQITIFKTAPKFIDSNVLQIDKTRVKANIIVIATGLTPRTLNIKGEHHLKTSDDFLSFKKLPKRMIFLGAGYIGLEFAQMAARMGSKVTIIDKGDRLLKSFDSDLATTIEKVSKDLGITFIYDAEIRSIHKSNTKLKLKYRLANQTKSKKADVIFNTAGRVPSISELNLEKANVSFDESGVKVDRYLRSTSNPKVYACGDVSKHSLPLSPLAGHEAQTVSQNIIQNDDTKIVTPQVPSVVFTFPNLAAVGYSEKEAQKHFKNIIIKQGNAQDWYNNKHVGGKAYRYKIIINERTDEIIGAHLIGAEAAEIINLFTLAINCGLKRGEMTKMIFTYPSWGNDIKSMLA